jgi:nucleotide-binding universal stress UspA family protein
MYKRILCPVDGSSTSSRGLQEAVNLAKNQQAKLRFIHVIDTYVPIIDGVGSLTPADMAEILEENAQKVIGEAKNSAKKAGVDVSSEVVEILGRRPSHAIIEQANQWPADLIVMGTHGLRGLNRLVMGSDAENVLRHSSVPVLLVKSAGVEEDND